MKKRLLSLDAFRGLDMLLIMGMGPVLRSLSKLFDMPTLAEQTQHVAWAGLHMEDLIFPTFLFLAGMSWPFSLARRRERGASRGELVKGIVMRMTILFMLGLVYDGILDFNFGKVRYLSVLGRIGIAWGVAALTTLFLSPCRTAVLTVLLMTAYWLASFLLPMAYAPGQHAFAQTVSIVTRFDMWLWPGHLADSPWGTEFWLATIGAVGTAFAGIFAGWMVRCQTIAAAHKTALLFILGGASLMLGFVALPVCPCIKNAWTPTFVLISAGIDLMLFAPMYFIVDVCGSSRWTIPLRVIGMNAVTIYMLQRFVDFKKVSGFFFGGLSHCCSNPDVAQLVLDVGYIVCCWCVLYFLYRRKIFLKV